MDELGIMYYYDITISIDMIKSKQMGNEKSKQILEEKNHNCVDYKNNF